MFFVRRVFDLLGSNKENLRKIRLTGIGSSRG
jgi:hypothetical protein